jgi:hypothetical protein
MFGGVFCKNTFLKNIPWNRSSARRWTVRVISRCEDGGSDRAPGGARSLADVGMGAALWWSILDEVWPKIEWWHRGSLPGASRGRGGGDNWRTACTARPLLWVTVTMAAGPKGRSASLLGQTDAVQCPKALCGSSSAWTVVLLRSNGKDNG